MIVRQKKPALLLFTLLMLLALPFARSGRGAEAYRRALERIDPSPHIEFLSSLQSRYTGYEGCSEAADYIEEQFRNMGLSRVSRDPFQIVIPKDGGAHLAVGDDAIPLYNVRPNYVRPPSTPETGIGGSIIWGGDGSLSALNGKEVEGNIVVMEFNVGTHWLNAAKLGASAVVFLEPEQAFRKDAEQKYLRVPAPLHRYYITRADLIKLAGALGAELQEDAATVRDASEFIDGLKGGADERRGTIFSEMAWEEQVVHMISAEVPGVDPDLSEEIMVVHAYYDSVSVVPSLSPGADSASGIAALLEIADFLRAHPPRRTVKLLATPAHFQALGGVRRYAEQQIFPRRIRETGSETEARGGEPHFFIGLDLSSRSNSMAGFYKGHFYDQYGQEQELRLQRIFSDYGSLLIDWAADISGRDRVAEKIIFQSGIVPRHGRGWRTLLPDRVAFDSEVITLSGRPAITLATTGDARNTVGTPGDTFDSVEPYLDNVRQQAVVCAYMVKKTADVPVIPLNNRPELGIIGSVFGRAIEQALTAYVPTVNVADAVVGVNVSTHKSMMGVMGRAYYRSDMSGLFEVFGLQMGRSVVLDGFRLSPSDGSIHRTAVRELIAPTDRPREVWEQRRTDVRLNFIESNSITFFDMTDPLRLARIPSATPLGAQSDSTLRDDVAVTFLGEAVAGTGYGEPVVVTFIRPDHAVKFMLGGNGGVLLNVPVELEEKTEAVRRPDAGEVFLGYGFDPTESEMLVFRTAYEIARDTHLLDYFRLYSLQQAAIRQENLWELHDTAYENLKTASQKLEDRQYDEFYKHSRQAWAIEGRVYPEARATSFDVVRGVVFYFALLLPFVIFIERLLINYVDIRKKLTAIAGLFAVSYLVLRFVHPAFQLARAPIIILDGFFMLVAGLWTIMYLLMKFRIVMEDFRKKVGTIHRADVARGSAAMAAFILGISNMRKRKVRTALTALTLVLLTFTILSFTSFETVPARMLRYQTGRPAAYEGLLLRGINWGALPEFEVEDVYNHFSTKNYNVVRRTWFVSPDPGQELNLPVRRNGSEIVANALLGLDPEETGLSRADQWLARGRWFDRREDDWPFVAILPESMAYALNVDPDDETHNRVNVMGRYVRVVGVFDSGKVDGYRDLDDEPLTPVDFFAQQYMDQVGMPGVGPAFTATGELSADEFITRMGREDEDEDRYVHMDADSLVIIPSDLCVNLGGTFRAVAAGPVDTDEGTSIFDAPFSHVLDEFSSRVNWPIFAGVDGIATRVMTRGRLSIGGLQGLLIPILIAALIVFNTMLGAVYERTGEITVYAAVGLAPIHIAALFLAESTVFAVVGAMLGYLFGQVVSFALLEVPWLMEGISLNYSSISAVWSALLVMAIVIASTAWPARMAGKLSVPDETKKFRIEKPTGDVWEIVFPFTVSTQESVGVMSYLREYFASNDEDSVGAFSAANIEFYEKESDTGEPVITMAVDVWIAPLDMGISEKVEIAAVPDEEEPKITLLYFTITRKSGEFATWQRMNKGFLKDVRKQMLIWRLITADEKKRLTAEGNALLDK